MTVQHAEAVVTAAHMVHDEVWFRYWREGKKTLRPMQVIDAIRAVRVKAGINEDDLPAGLVKVLKLARTAKGDKQNVPLADLIEALKMVFLPPRQEV